MLFNLKAIKTKKGMNTLHMVCTRQDSQHVQIFVTNKFKKYHYFAETINISKSPSVGPTCVSVCQKSTKKLMYSDIISGKK